MRIPRDARNASTSDQCWAASCRWTSLRGSFLGVGPVLEPAVDHALEQLMGGPSSPAPKTRVQTSRCATRNDHSPVGGWVAAGCTVRADPYSKASAGTRHRAVRRSQLREKRIYDPLGR